MDRIPLIPSRKGAPHVGIGGKIFFQKTEPMQPPHGIGNIRGDHQEFLKGFMDRLLLGVGEVLKPRKPVDSIHKIPL